MGYLAIILGTGILGLIIGRINDGRGFKPHSYFWPWTIIPAFFLLVFGGIFSGVESGSLNRDDDPVTLGCTKHQVSIPIISINRQSNLSGSFVLGTGGVDTVERYYAYIEKPMGYKLVSFSTKYTYIVETDDQPRLERTDWVCSKTLANFLWYPYNGTKYNYGREEQLFVPKNTILRKFEL